MDKKFLLGQYFLKNTFDRKILLPAIPFTSNPRLKWNEKL